MRRRLYSKRKIKEYEMVSGRSLAIDQATVLNVSKMTIFVIIIGIFIFLKNKTKQADKN